MVELEKKQFDDFYLSDETLRALETINYSEPTPVQEASIPLVMAGIDLIVQAQTGTGKTAAFAIPIVEMLDTHPGRVDVLVLAPTRELARQVSEEFDRIGQYKSLDVTTIYGGTGYEQQYEALETAQIVTATPGRLLDLLQRGKIDLSQLRVFCLDEADEMLSMGFQEELDAIMAFLPEERQSLLFSATITEEVKALANSMLYYPEFITLSSDSVAAEQVEHAYYNVRGVGRTRDLLKILDYEEPETAIIFANTRDDTFMVTNFLKRHGMRAEVLNGDLPQKERERTLAALKKGEIDYLVATDVAARGIDISELSHVFNYVLPDNAEVYIHRTGRTGRAGKKGRAISLISPREIGVLFNIKKHYKLGLEPQELPSPKEILEVKRKRHIARLSERIESLEGLPYGGQLGVAEQLLERADDDQARVRMVAKLLALAEDVMRGGASAAGAAKPAKVEEAEPTPAPEEAIAPQIEEAQVEEVEEDVVVEEVEEAEESRRGGRRRGRRREEPEAEEAEASAAESDEEQESEEGSRRRRRRRGGDSSRRRSSRSRGRSSSRKRESSQKRESSRKRESSQKRESSRKRDSSRRRKSSRGGRRRQSSRDRREETTAAAPAATEHAMSKMWVNVGRDRMDSRDQIVEMVCYMAGMDPEDIGSVSLESSFSYVEVREDYFYDIINAMNNQEWNGVTIAAEPARK